MYHQQKNDYADKFQMQSDIEYEEKNKDIGIYFREFYNNSTINMYEYADNEAIEDTLMYYYLANNSVEVYYKIANENIISLLMEQELTIEVLGNNIGEIVDILYLYSFCIEKYPGYHNLYNDNLEEIVRNVYEYIQVLNDKTTEMYVHQWKLCRLANELEMDLGEFSSWKEYREEIIPSEGEKEVLDIIDILFQGLVEKEKVDINEYFKRYTDMYEFGIIDIETYIIYIGLLSDLYEPDLGMIAEDEIYTYCMDNFYMLSPMTRFMAFKTVMVNVKYQEAIQMKYLSMPKNEKGMVSTTCIIIPTYRRLYGYLEICKKLDINIDEEAIGQWIRQINIEQIRVEDFFYAYMLFEEYPQLEINITPYLEQLGEKLTRLKINETNSYNVYSALKALVCAGKKNKDLYSNYMVYFKENASRINEIEMLWKAELEYIYENKNPDIKLICEEMVKVQKEIEIEYYYYLVNLLIISQNKIEAQDADIIMDRVKAYRVTGGYYANPEFQYVDIFRTYQSVFIEDKIANVID